MLWAHQRGVAGLEAAVEAVGRFEVCHLAPLGRDAAPGGDAAAVAHPQGTPESGWDGTDLRTGLERNLVRSDEDSGDAHVGEHPAHLGERERAEMFNVDGSRSGEKRPIVDGHHDVGTHAVSGRCLRRAERDLGECAECVRADLFRRAPLFDRNIWTIRLTEGMDRRGDGLGVDSGQTGMQVQHAIGTGRHPQTPLAMSGSLIGHRGLMVELGLALAAVRSERDRVMLGGEVDQLALEPEFVLGAAEVTEQFGGMPDMLGPDEALCERLGDQLPLLEVLRIATDLLGLRR